MENSLGELGKMYCPKNEGGLDFQDLSTFNYSF